MVGWFVISPLFLPIPPPTITTSLNLEIVSSRCGGSCCLTECPLTWIIQFLITSVVVAPAAILLGTANLDMYPRLNLSKVFIDPLGRSNIGLVAGRIGSIQELSRGDP